MTRPATVNALLAIERRAIADHGRPTRFLKSVLRLNGVARWPILLPKKSPAARAVPAL